MRVLGGAVVGVVAVIVVVAAELLLRGLGAGAFFALDGTLVALVSLAAAGLAGAVVVALAVVATRVGSTFARQSWGAAAAVVIVVLVAGCVALEVGLSSPPDVLQPAPTLWLQTAASSALAWALAGIALALALRRPRRAEDAAVTET